MFASFTLLALSLATPAPQGTTPAPAPTPAAAAATTADAPDPTEVDPAEPDFTVVNMPTTLRMPKGKIGFSVTHRFARPLGRGDLGDLAADLFGFDAGGQIGLGLRVGVTARAQLGIYRTSDRTITLFGQHGILTEGSWPVSLDAIASVEGLDNLQDEHSLRLGVVVSRRLGTRGAVYAMPAFVGNTNLRFPEEEDDATVVVGLGGRFRLTDALYVVGEVTPAVTGFETPNGGAHASFGIEHRVGGHSFQINFSNDLGTTPAQVARGKQGEDAWFIGFNISRKFY
jgi:hypothetical protein